MMRRGTKVKLVAFVVITTLTVAYILIDYIQLPKVLGLGRYQVAMELDAANGLYPKAVVTYRGIDVGAVTGLRPTDDGIVVDLAINDDTEIPADLVAEVHSTSAVGEQFVNLVPKGSDGPLLADGDIIPRQRTEVPITTTALLDNLHELVDSVPLDALSTTVDELGDAFANSGDDLQLLLDSSMKLNDEAQRNLGPTLSLVRNLAPVLETQRDSGPDISSYTRDLASFTAQLAASDDDIRNLLDLGPGVTAELNKVYADLGETLPDVLADSAKIGEVSRAYLPALEHTLIVYPALIAAGQSVVPPSQMKSDYPLFNLDFKLSVNNPPVCVQGFEYAKQQRDPSDMRPAPLPKDSYCKVPNDDPRVVRGARNLPCPNNPNRRSPDAAGCGLVFGSSGSSSGTRTAGGSTSTAAPELPELLQQLTKPPQGMSASLYDLLGIG